MKKFLKYFLGTIVLLVFFVFLFLRGCDWWFVEGMETSSRLEHAPPLIFRIDGSPPITLTRQHIGNDSHTMYYDYSSTSDKSAISVHVTVSPVNFCTWPKILPFLGCKPELFDSKKRGDQNTIILDLAVKAADAFFLQHKNDSVSPTDQKTLIPAGQHFQANYTGPDGRGLVFSILNQGSLHFTLLPVQTSLSKGITDATIIIFIPTSPKLGLAYTFTLTSTSPDPKVRALWLNKLIAATENVEHME